MRSPAELIRFLLARLDRRRLDRDMDYEMALHIELHAEALERAGVSPAEARRQAVVEFGGVQRYREEARDVRALTWIHGLLADFRYALRTLRRSPVFGVVSVVSLGLGIGANVAIFGLLYGVLIQRLAIPRAGELAALVVDVKGDQYTAVKIDTYLALRAVPGAPELSSLHETDNVLTEAGDLREYMRVDFVDGGFFRLVGVQPMFGRTITPEDDTRSESVVVLSEDLWVRAFGADRSVLGRRILLRSQPFTVIGIMPHSFRGIRFNGSFNLAVPASAARVLDVDDDHNSVNVVTRASNPAARVAFAAPLEVAFHQCCLAREDLPAATRLYFVDASRGIPFGKNDFRDDYRLILWSLMGAVLLVLFVACSNVGNLLLARAATRNRELAIRLSIGASRWRLVRQLLAESTLLAALGAGLGIGLAALATRLFIAALPTAFGNAAVLVEFGPKPAILGFTAAVAALCVLAFGVGPALRATSGDLARSIQDRGDVRRRDASIVDRLLVIGQVAVTLVLVCGAGLLVATLHNLRTTDPGFSSTHLVGIHVETRGTDFERYGIVPLHREILERVRAAPGVLAAAMATRVPAIGGREASFPYAVIGEPVQHHAQVSITVVTPGFFATAATALLAGRDFTDADTPGNARVAIANEKFVRQNLGDRSPIGAAVRISGLNGGEIVTIVGIARDVRFGDRRSLPDPMLYIPAAQAGNWPFFLLLLRTGPDPEQVMPMVRRALEPWSSRLRISGPQSMDEAFDEVLLRERLGAALASSCAALALLLAMIGLAGLVAFSVARRTREIGVRMALGARRAGIVWLVLRGALLMVGAGVVLGGPLALGVGRALRSLLYGIAPTNLLLLGGAAAALVVVAALTSALPAWRAARVDPVIALRAD